MLLLTAASVYQQPHPFTNPFAEARLKVERLGEVESFRGISNWAQRHGAIPATESERRTESYDGTPSLLQKHAKTHFPRPSF